MKIIIFGDTHLGRRNFKIKQRELDFQNAFTQVIKYAIKNADIVIHTGDLFDIGKPSIETILFTIQELKKLKEKNIPFFIIAGSHDISVEGSFLKILDQIGLLINLSDKKYYSNEEDKIIIKGETIKNTFVCGLPGRRSRINEIMELLQPEFDKKAFKIFVFHHIIDDINPLFSSVKKSSLPKGFDLYLSGHWHEHFETTYENKKLLYSGSSESCDLKDMYNKEKGFILYNTENNSHKFIKLENRESKIASINCDGLSTEEVNEKIKNEIKNGNGEMLLILLKGRIKSGIKSELNKQEIYDLAKNKGYLFCKIYTGNLENPEETQTTIQKKSINEIEKEFFENKGFSINEIIIAQNLIKELGNKISNSKIEEKIPKIINYLEGEIKLE